MSRSTARPPPLKGTRILRFVFQYDIPFPRAELFYTSFLLFSRIRTLLKGGRSAALGAVPLLDAPRRHPVEELEKVVLDADDV